VNQRDLHQVAKFNAPGEDFRHVARIVDGYTLEDGLRDEVLPRHV